MEGTHRFKKSPLFNDNKLNITPGHALSFCFVLVEWSGLDRFLAVALAGQRRVLRAANLRLNDPARGRPQ